MAEISPKSPELIQAQVASFAAETVVERGDREHIFENIGSLVIGDMGDVTRVTTRTERHRDENGNRSLKIPEGTEVVVATGDEYTNFLRTVGGSRSEAIQGRAEMLEEYARFEPVVARLRTELSDPATREEHPDFLGNGSNATVFAVQEGDKKYAVRVPNGRAVNPLAIDDHLAGAVLGKGISHLEQIVAASYIDGVTVAEVMPGKEVGALTSEEISMISDEQLSELVDTLRTANDSGIQIDLKPSNFLYDPAEGYGIVDYHSSKVADGRARNQEFSDIVGGITVVIDNAGFYGKPSGLEKTIEYYSQDLELMRASLEVMKRYRSIVESKLGGEDQQKALKRIDERIQLREKTVEDYSNPWWVADTIAQDREAKRKRAEQPQSTPTTADNGGIELDLV